MVKKLLAWLPMYLIYYIGVMASEILNSVPDWDYAWLRPICDGLYITYNKCMFWSLLLNDWAGLSLWTRAISTND